MNGALRHLEIRETPLMPHGQMAVMSYNFV